MVRRWERGSDAGRTTTTRIEFDHRIAFADTRHTRLDELDGACKHHHDGETYDGWALVAGTGRRVPCASYFGLKKSAASVPDRGVARREDDLDPLG